MNPEFIRRLRCFELTSFEHSRQAHVSSTLVSPVSLSRLFTWQQFNTLHSKFKHLQDAENIQKCSEHILLPVACSKYSGATVLKSKQISMYDREGVCINIIWKKSTEWVECVCDSLFSILFIGRPYRCVSLRGASQSSDLHSVANSRSTELSTQKDEESERCSLKRHPKARIN